MGRMQPIKADSEVTSSVHENVSRGYTKILDNGERVFVPYTRNEMGEIHSFITPQIERRKHMKWTKTHTWKDQAAAKKARFRYHPTFGGLNTKKK